MGRRRVVLDANILIRAVLGRRVRELIAAHAGDVDFFTPQVAYDDAVEHLPAVLAKHQRVGEIEPALALLSELLQSVLTVPEEIYFDLKPEALARIERRDPDDWPVLAIAILLDCPVWTEDNDFFGAGVPTWTTDRIDIYLNGPT